jgi:N utilization substance protein B
MGRRRARELAFMLLYSYEVQKDDHESQRQLFVAENNLADDDLTYFDRLLDGVSEHVAAIDERIAPTLNKWDITRLPLIDLTILRIGTFEMCFADDVPRAASINECVVLAKKYSNDESRAYINAVLGTIYRTLNPEQTPDETVFDEDT